MIDSLLTSKEIDLLVHHYTVEVNRWTGVDDPLMLGMAKRRLEVWERAQRDADRDSGISTTRGSVTPAVSAACQYP